MIPESTFIHITDVIKLCIEQNKKVGMYPVSGDHWMDMGQIDELKIMTERLESI
jgi:dTDP-glucose pyrophosphorylase